MKYAIVSTGGKQYKVSEGDILELELLSTDPQKEYIFPQVLLHVDGDKRLVGAPTLSNVVVKATVLSHGKGEKIRVAKFKAKSRYRRVMGFRPSVTKIRIEKIGNK